MLSLGSVAKESYDRRCSNGETNFDPENGGVYAQLFDCRCLLWDCSPPVAKQTVKEAVFCVAYKEAVYMCIHGLLVVNRETEQKPGKEGWSARNQVKKANFMVSWFVLGAVSGVLCWPKHA